MKKFLIILIALMCNAAFAQLQNIPLVTVTGEAAIKRTPDYVILGLRIQKEIRLNSDSKPIFEIFKSEDTKIRLFGFDDKDISQSVIQTDSVAYVKEVFITINDISKLEKYLLELFNLGYRNCIFTDYRVRNYIDYKNQARKDAINSAKKKAIVLANELGQTIGKANTIEELYTEDFNWYCIQDKNNFINNTSKSDANGYNVEPGYIIITSKVKVSFDLQK